MTAEFVLSKRPVLEIIVAFFFFHKLFLPPYLLYYEIMISNDNLVQGRVNQVSNKQRYVWCQAKCGFIHLTEQMQTHFSLIKRKMSCLRIVIDSAAERTNSDSVRRPKSFKKL